MASEKTERKDASNYDRPTVESQDSTTTCEDVSSNTVLSGNPRGSRSVWRTPRVEQTGPLVPNTFSGSAGNPIGAP